MHAENNENEEVRRLSHEYVPAVANGSVEIMGIARARGARVIVSVRSKDERVDPVGACVGARGSRVRTWMQQLPGEKVAVVRWADSPKTFLSNALAPARIDDIFFQKTAHRAVIFTDFEGKQSIVGNDGSRLKLVSQLVGWDIQVETG